MVLTAATAATTRCEAAAWWYHDAILRMVARNRNRAELARGMVQRGATAPLLAMAAALGLATVGMVAVGPVGRTELAHFTPDHPAKHYVPLPNSPLGTDAVFTGSGDGEGVTMAGVRAARLRARTQALSAQLGAGEPHMNMAACKAWGQHFADRWGSKIHTTPQERRIAAHCEQVFARIVRQQKMATAAAKVAAPNTAASATHPLVARTAVGHAHNRNTVQHKRNGLKAKEPRKSLDGTAKVAPKARRWTNQRHASQHGRRSKASFAARLPGFPRSAYKHLGMKQRSSDGQMAADLAEYRKEGLI